MLAMHDVASVCLCFFFHFPSLVSIVNSCTQISWRGKLICFCQRNFVWIAEGEKTVLVCGAEVSRANFHDTRRASTLPVTRRTT